MPRRFRYTRPSSRRSATPSAYAVRVTAVPGSTVVVQADPHAIPPEPDTVPDPRAVTGHGNETGLVEDSGRPRPRGHPRGAGRRRAVAGVSLPVAEAVSRRRCCRKRHPAPDRQVDFAHGSAIDPDRRRHDAPRTAQEHVQARERRELRRHVLGALEVDVRGSVRADQTRDYVRRSGREATDAKPVFGEVWAGPEPCSGCVMRLLNGLSSTNEKENEQP